MPAYPDGHEPPCDCGSYGCDLRAKGVQVSPAATPNRRNVKPSTTAADPAWERGIPGEHRPGGSFMPYLDVGTGKHLGVKQFSEHRHGFEESLRRVRNTPAPERT